MITTNAPLKTRYILLAAFFIPVLVLLGICICRGIFPFGNQVYLRSDMYHQYAPFMKEFQRILHSGGSLLYSWNIGLGNNFASTYSYYLASPFNWLVGLFPEHLLPEFLLLTIILKTGLMSVSFAWYLKHRFLSTSYYISVWGCFYAMSAYMIAYNYNIMWLDCLVLFPLILAGLEDLVKKRGFWLYTITLALSCLSNYYISIMLSFFLVLYFLYLLLCEKSGMTWGETGKCLFRFIVCSILSGMLAMVTILPAWYNLFLTASFGSGFPTEMKMYFSPLQILTRSMINTEVSMLSGHLPNIYCTMLVFLLMPLFLTARRIPCRERVGKFCLLAVLAISFMFSIPTYIWHGFHFPNGLPCRYSFIYVILVLVMGYQAFLNIRTISSIRVGIYAIGGMIVIFLMHVGVSDLSYTTENAMLGAFFVAFYAIIFLLLKCKFRYKRVITGLFLVLSAAELTINAYNTGFSTMSRASYVAADEEVQSLLALTGNNSFYRVENLSAKTKNKGAWDGYRSASAFSSTIAAGNSWFYADLGLLGKTNSYSYAGHTPFTQALLGVRYELTNKIQSDPLAKMITFADHYFLYENRYTLPLGFMVRSEFLTSFTEDVDPFLLQNLLIQNASGVREVFHLQKPGYGKTIQFTAAHDGRFPIYVPATMDRCSVMILRENDLIRKAKHDHLEISRILDLGDVKKDDQIIIQNKDANAIPVSILPAIMDYERYKEAFRIISHSPLEITDFSDTHITGHITVSAGQVLFTTIPYDPGWTLYVDGNETAFSSFADSFIVCKLPEGEHAVEFRYFPPGLLPGAVISASGLAICLVLVLLTRRRAFALAPHCFQSYIIGGESFR